jgi:starch synthase
MKVLSVTSEIFPLVKTGGLADVAGSLPLALRQYGIETKTLLPGYPSVMQAVARGPRLADISVLGQGAGLISANHEGLELLILDCPALFYRQGGPYIDENGVDHLDNWKRFATLSKAAAEIAGGLLPGWRPDVVHTHDWQAALTPAYMRAAGVDVPSLLTIHNLAFQGQYPAELFPYLDLPDSFFATNCMEYYGDMCFLKAGIALSDMVTTVSPTYAREILTKDLGMGLGGMLSGRRGALRGIVNGVDLDVWNPETDVYIPENYNEWTLDKRSVNRAALVEEFGLNDDGGPIFSVISRLTWQKGLDLLVPVIPGLLDLGGKLIVHGQGDRQIVEMLQEAAAHYPGQVSVHVGFEEAKAHLIHAGSDSVIQPSRFEPCGLTQLYALRYGAPPIVAHTGGLAETIIDANDAGIGAGVATGFQFKAGSIEDLYHAIERAVSMHDRPAMWQNLQIQGMKTDFSWERSAQQYAALYTEVGRRRQSGGNQPAASHFHRHSAGHGFHRKGYRWA